MSDRKSNHMVLHTIAGSVAGIASAVVSCPLDIVKFRLQNASTSKTTFKGGTLSSLRNIYTLEGVTGLYRGVGPTASVYLVDRAIWFPLYHWFKISISSTLDCSINSPLVHLNACVASSALTLIATHPLWLVRTRIMIFGSPTFDYDSLAEGIRRMIKQEGLSSLYKGFVPSLIGISHVAVQFPLYEQFKLYCEKRRRRLFLESNKNWPKVKNDETRLITSLDLVVSSALSKLIASALTYPHEVLRTRLLMQTHHSVDEKTAKYRGLGGALKTIIKEEGILGLYKGLGTTLLRTVPAATISIYMYEIIVNSGTKFLDSSALKTH